MRFRICVEYDGRDFVGWQRQANGLGVQEVIETAIEKFCGETTTVFGAGRTDAGVHALGQVAHFDLDGAQGPDTVRDALNFHIKPLPVAILSAEVVGDDFNARFSATERTYLYRIINRRPPITIDHGHAWWVPTPLDADAMHRAAQVLVGQHDFTTFRASICQAQSAVKTLDQLDVERIGDEIRLHVRARSFLHHQVRNFTGTLRLVGEGRWTADDLKAALDARDRTRGGQTAPADGLYLVSVGY